MPAGETLYLGIDEAGYGPRLGPLCIGIAGFSLPASLVSGNNGPPADLWAALGDAAVRKGPSRDLSGALAIDDSKKLLRGATRDTAHLQRAVCAALTLLDGACEPTDAHVLQRLCGELAGFAWDPASLEPTPLGMDAGRIGIAANLLRGACASTGVAVQELRACAVGETIFNAERQRLGSKAAVNLRRALSLLRAALRTHKHANVYAAIDRQSGRTKYASALSAAFPKATVAILDESPERSLYALRGPSRVCTVEFRVSAESHHLPTALASMTAKLVRELCMARFNRFWRQRMPELKPTAGYGADANRWLRDAAQHLPPAERDALVRLA